MFRIIASILFVVVVVGVYFATHNHQEEVQDVTPVTTPVGNSNFNL